MADEKVKALLGKKNSEMLSILLSDVNSHINQLNTETQTKDVWKGNFTNVLYMYQMMVKWNQMWNNYKEFHTDSDSELHVERLEKPNITGKVNSPNT